jgi:Sec-independent protein secretion pathway component TatC
VPMWALFEGSIWLAVLVEQMRPEALAIDPFEAVVQPPD